ncbi:hypothetical protein ACUJ8N_34930 [Streptomyces sp. ESR1.13]|uniref:hypothetical protein n=1 Tax=unclassified Streptomyces TaxID=2593676 RepID=UPI0040431B4A
MQPALYRDPGSRSAPALGRGLAVTVLEWALPPGAGRPGRAALVRHLWRAVVQRLLGACVLGTGVTGTAHAVTD